MSVSSYYRVTWQLLILLVAALGIGSGVVRPLAALPYLVAASALMTSSAARLPETWRRRLTFVLGLSLFGLGVHEVLRIDRFEDLVPAMLEVLCGFLPVVLMTHERPRSYWLAALTVVVVAVGGISVTTNVAVYVGFLAFIAVLLLNLNAATLRGPGLTELPQGYFRQFLLTVPAGALAAALIFFAFPRVESFTMSLGRMVAKSRTGYSGLVNLSGEGEIEASPALALIVDAVDKTWLRSRAGSLLLRGDALDTFDGSRWSAGAVRFTTIDRQPDLRLASRQGSDTNQLRIHVEPQTTTAVFYPDVLLAAGPLSAGAGRLLVSANGSLARDVFTFERFAYTVRTSPALPAEALPVQPLARLAAAVSSLPGLKETGDRPAPAYVLSPADARLDLAVPVALRDAPWFKTWAAGLHLDPEHDSLAATERKIAADFTSRFEATLANRFSGAGSTLEAFLATDHRGHCEYFATATALLLRTLGIPTRVVVGYRGGTYNELIDMLEVREENAHAWVEAFVPGLGWHAIDPTPAGVVPVDAGFYGTARLFVNAASFWFHQYVIDYDQARQRELLRTIGHGWDQRHRGGDGAWLSALKARARPLALAGLACVFAWAALRRLRSRRRRSSTLPAWYEGVVRRFELAGHVRRPGETFAAFHARIAAAGVDPDLVQAVQAALEAELYAERPAAPDATAALVIRAARLPVPRRRSKAPA